MINICEYCKKEYEYEEGQPNWGKNGPVTGRQFSMSSKRFCCYECGIKASNEKNKQTKLERYGSSTYNNTNKSKQTKLDKYGTASYVNVEQQKETRLKKLKSDSQYYKKQQEKREQTCLDKYGVKSVMQSGSSANHG